jgi:hypothetical protein
VAQVVPENAFGVGHPAAQCTGRGDGHRVPVVLMPPVTLTLSLSLRATLFTHLIALKNPKIGVELQAASKAGFPGLRQH